MSVPCRSCGAEVVWLVHEGTGKPAPIDAEPNPAGNVVRVGESGYLIAPAARGDAELIPRKRYMPHFASCPDRDAWRS
jgi:hypothetical protein